MKKKVMIIIMLISILIVSTAVVYANTTKMNTISIGTDIEKMLEFINPEQYIVDVEIIEQKEEINEAITPLYEEVIEKSSKEDPTIIESDKEIIEFDTEKPTITNEIIVEKIIEEYPEEYKLTKEAFEINYDESTISNEIFDGEIIEPEIVNTRLTEKELQELENDNNLVYTIDAAVTEPSADGIEIEFTNQEIEVSIINNVGAKYLGLSSGAKKAITVIGDDAMMDINKLQAAIDANNIICYPSCDMTKGVKYLAGHNPGAMSHINSMQVDSIVRLSNDEGYQDYKVVERLQGVTGSFVNAVFNTTGLDAWTMITRGNENALIIQFCVNGQNNLWYCKAI